MGAKLVKFFELAKEEGGLSAQMRLAMATGISTVKASSEADTPEVLAKFKAAFKEITGKDVGIA